MAGLELGAKMQFTPTSLDGVWTIQLEPLGDDRGLFVRLWGSDEFRSCGVAMPVVACNLSTNPLEGTLRGMHFQAAPHAEAKVVQCIGGAIYDVAIDLRPDSATFCRWHGEVLSKANRRALYIPEGFAHGFLTLENDSEVLYMMSASYSADHARGVRWDDPAFAVDWPGSPRVMSDRDRSFDDFSHQPRQEAS